MNKNSNIIIKYDGQCNLCNYWVNFIKQRDDGNNLIFTNHNNTETIIIEKNGIKKYKIDAIIEILENINFSSLLLYIIKKIPIPFLNYIYKLISNNRYFFFNTKNCIYKSKKNNY